MMEIKREELRKALEIIKPGLARKEVIEQTTSFVFMNGRVVTYNDEISISHPVPNLDVSGVVKPDELYKLLSKLKQEEITLEVTENEIILKAGKAKAGFTLVRDIKLPLGETGLDALAESRWPTLPENFVEGVQFAMQSCGHDMSRPKLTGVHITPTFAEGSDMYRLSVHKFKTRLGIDEVLIPASSMKVVCARKPTHVFLDTAWIHFRNEEDTIISCRIFQDKYADTSKIREVDGLEIQFPKSIREMLDRVSIFSKREHFVDEAITIALSEKRITISGQSDSAWFEETANVRYSGEVLEFRITPDLLFTIIDQANICTLTDNKIKFAGEDWEYLAMLRK